MNANYTRCLKTYLAAQTAPQQASLAVLVCIKFCVELAQHSFFRCILPLGRPLSATYQLKERS